MTTRRRLLAAFLATALSAAGGACGSRLSIEERAAMIAAHDRSDDIALTEQFTNTANVASSPGDAEEPSAVSTTTGGDATSVAAADAQRTASVCGATSAKQPGLSDDRIVISTIADVSGLQPGIFQGAHRGARAAAAYINSQGGICGRRIDPLLLDDKTDAGGNRAATLDACQQSFLIIGSMSAFDDGGARPGQECGIPDITAITTTEAKYRATNVFPAYPNSPVAVSTTNARYIAKHHPQAAKKAALLWLNIAVGKAAADARKAAWEAEGFEFIYETEVQLLEPNFTRYVSEMERRGVRYVHFVGDFQNMVRMQKSMRQQGYVPEVRDFDSITYDPDYLRDPDVVKGSLTFINFAPFDETSNPEMKLFLDWLARTSPGEAPDSFSLYAWSGYRLFQTLAAKAGPNLTRKRILELLKATASWDSHGLHGAQRIGVKLPTTCNLYLRADGDRFSRVYPASGFDCNGSVLRR